ncbi:MAG: ATP-binding protein [bacterium]
MLNWNRYSLRRQLILLFLIVQLILLLGLMIYYNYSQRQLYLDHLKSSLYNQANLIKEFKITNINQASPGIINQWSKEMSVKINKRITIVDKYGIVIADSDYNTEEMDNHIDRPEIQDVLGGQDIGTAIRYSNTLNMDMYYLAIPIRSEESLTGFIRVSESLEDINKTISSNITSNLLFFFFMLLITLLLVWKLTKDIINPLSQITRIADNLARGNFQEKIMIKGYDNEIGTLARVFNHMAKQLESKINQISEEKNRAEAILTSMVDGLIATDINLKIRIINPAAKKIFELGNIAVKGIRVIEVFRHHEIEHTLDTAMEENEIITKEIVIQKTETRTLKCNFVPINNDQGLVTGGIVVFSDITELRRLEQMRKEFVANVSHELRTPLTSIIGYLDTILENDIDDMNTIERFLYIIKKEADRLAVLIKDLLDLSKLEGKNKYVLRPGLLNNLIEKSILILKEKARKKDIEIRKEVSSEFMVYMIPEQIEQVLINLMDNAIKYTSAGGVIVVRAYYRYDKVVIEVSDNGIGIPPEEQDRIFERFYRVDKARVRSFGGTGIGLSIVKHVIQNHNNKIEVESQPDKGSTFRFYLDKVNS